jgi:signal transduction histidine kinase
MEKKMHSIHTHLITRLLGGFILLLSLASALVYFISKEILESDFNDRLHAKAEAATASVAQQADRIEIDWTNLPQEWGKHNKKSDLILILDGSGKSLGGDASLNLPGLIASGRNVYHDVTLPSGRKLRVLALSFQPHIEPDDLPVTPPNLRRNCLLVVGSDRTALVRSLHDLAAVLAGMTLLTSVFSLCIVFMVLRRGLQPLSSLSRAVARMDEATLGHGIDLESLPVELLPIAEKLNDLLRRLGVSFAREKRFNADVSHELRTPIAELRSLAEVMLRQPDHLPEAKRAFQDTLEATCQMESLVTVLLEIVRNEQNPQKLHFSKLNVIALAREVWHGFEKKALDKGLSVNLPSPEREMVLETEPRLLRIILSNLFSNAVEYTPEKGWIEVGLEEYSGSVCLVVANTVGSLTPVDLPHLFERFWRKDAVRGNSEHFGLGLSLAETLSQRLGMALTASMKQGNTIRFRLRLPVSTYAART